MSPRDKISLTASEHCNTGELVAPVDQITKFVDNLIDRPVYHDLTQPAWLKYDVSEWSSKVHKYKQEVVRNTQRLRLLKEEVDALRKQFANDTKEFETLEIEAEKAVDEFNKSQERISEETRRRAELVSDVSSLKRHKQNLLKAQAQMKEETSHMKVRIGNLVMLTSCIRFVALVSLFTFCFNSKQRSRIIRCVTRMLLERKRSSIWSVIGSLGNGCFWKQRPRKKL
eukprot:Selendium_serpulae@DN5300_c0_g1_i1.p1